jgi:hypothetical protein
MFPEELEDKFLVWVGIFIVGCALVGLIIFNM